MTQFNSAFTFFLSLLVEAIPFLLIGVLFSGILQFFVDERRLVALMPKNPLLGAIAGSCIGFLFPVCECGNIPVARRLITQGVPVSVSIGFLLAAPVVNPIVIWSTWIVFRTQPEMVLYRIGFSLLIAIIVAVIFSLQKDLRPFLQPAIANILTYRMESQKRRTTTTTRGGFPTSGGLPTSGGIPTSGGSVNTSSGSNLLQSGTYFLGRSARPLITDPYEMQAVMSATVTKAPGYRLRLLLENMLQELRELGGVLVLGSAMAAIFQVFIPRSAILGLGQDSVTSILAMMATAGLLSICSTVDSIFAASFAASFSTGSLVAFLVFGPMVDLKGIGLMLSIFKPLAVAYLVALPALLTFFLTLLMNFYFS
jgi:hypothetical protein